MPKKPRGRIVIDSQMLKSPKGGLNLHGSIFVIFFDQPEGKPTGRVLF